MLYIKRHILLTLLVVLSLAGQANDVYFHPISRVGGLGYGSVTGFAQDADGFMWIVTGDNIYRYDGYTFRAYHNKIARPEEWLIAYWSVLYTQSEDLYVTTSCGVLRYDRETDNFTKVTDCVSRSICEDMHGRLWLDASGIVCYDPKTGTKTPLSVGNYGVTGRFYTSPSIASLYVIANETLLSVSLQTGEQRFHSLDGKLQRVTAMEWQDSTLYLLCEKRGLWEFRDSLQCILPLEGSMSARKLLAAFNHRLWIGTMHGLFSYDAASGSLKHYVQTNQDGSLVSNSIQALYSDKNGNLWVGTYAGGLCLASAHVHNDFHSVRLQDYGCLNLPISALLEDHGYLWIGTEGDGLYCWHADKGIVAHYKQSTDGLGANNIKSLVKTGNKLWIGTYLGGLSCLNTATGRFTTYTADQKEHLILSNQIYALCQDGDAMWILYQSRSDMMTYFRPKEKTSRSIAIPEPIGEYVSSRPFNVFKMGNDIFLSTTTSLLRFSRADGSFLTSYSPNKPYSICSLCADTVRDGVWMGTRNGGLLFFDRTQEVFRMVVDEPSNELSKINTIALMDSTVWMGTDNGVASYSTGSGSLHVYNRYDGVCEHILSSCVSSDGTQVYWSGLGTLNHMETGGVKYNTCPPHTLVADLSINNQSVFESEVYTDKISQLRNGKLVLRNNENNIAITLSSTNYLLSGKNRYRFRMIPVSFFGAAKQSSSWSEVDAWRRTFSLVQVPAGRYRIEMQACNNDGVWGDTIVLTMRVKPIFWASGWAWLLYILLFSIIAACMVYAYIRHNRLKNELHIAQVRQEEEKKASRAKVRFFTDVSKELKAPLLRLQSEVDIAQVPEIQQMLRVMDRYTDKYCIDIGSNRKEQQIESQLDRFTQLVSEHMAEHTDIDALAREMGMSRRKLFSFIKDNTGKSIIEYIRSYRMSTAAKLLLEQNLTILDVMERVGISSQSYFVKSFKAEFGDTPSDFVAKMSKKNTKI